MTKFTLPHAGGSVCFPIRQYCYNQNTYIYGQDYFSYCSFKYLYSVFTSAVILLVLLECLAMNEKWIFHLNECLMLVLYISIFRHNTTYLQHVPIYLQLLPMHHTYTHNTYLPTTSTYIKYTTISNTHAPKTPTYLQDIPTSHTYHMHVSLPMATHALNVYTHQFFYRIFRKLYVPTLSSLPPS